MLELLAGAAVAAAILLFVLEPLVRPAVELPADEDEPVPMEESESPKVQALLALQEIEFDHATGKLTDGDYARMKSRYEGAALAALRAEDRDGVMCPQCGPRPESMAGFCSECGSALTA